MSYFHILLCGTECRDFEGGILIWISVPLKLLTSLNYYLKHDAADISINQIHDKDDN